MRAYEIVVFDLDGTLLDTLDDLHASVNAALCAHGMPTRTKDEVRRFVGNGIALLVHRAVPAQTPVDAEASVLASFKEHYALHACDRTAPYPHVPDLLSDLRSAGVATAVVSNKADFAVQNLVEHHFGHAFDAVLGECEERGLRKKPAPDMVETVLGQLGHAGAGTPSAAPASSAPSSAPAPLPAPARLVYVGDSEVDVATARAAGCACIGCAWGFRGRATLEAAGADLVVDTVPELERVLLATADEGRGADAGSAGGGHPTAHLTFAEHRHNTGPHGL